MNKSYLSKFSTVFFILCLFTINVTKVVSFTETLKFNIALSDIFIPVFLLVLLFFWKEIGFRSTFKYIVAWFALVLWIVLVGYRAIISDAILDSGWMGLFVELTKTGLCILYFFLGYHTLRVLKLKSFNWLWALSTLVFVIAGFAIYILAIKGLYFWSDDPKYLKIFMGTDTDPNHSATYLTLSFFGMGIFALLSNGLKSKLLFYAIMFISAVGLVFTGSRGGLIGFMVGVVILLCFYVYKNWHVALAMILVLIMMTMVFLTVDYFFLENVFTQRLLYKLVDIESGFDTRGNLSRTAWMMAVDHPLFGVGRGNFILNSPQYFEKLGVAYIENIPHNTFFGLIAETGVIGLTLFCMPFLLLLVTLIKRYKNYHIRLKEEFPIFVWIVAGVVALGIQAFVLNVENRRFLWYLAGVLIFIFENESILVYKNLTYKNKKLMTIGLTLLIIVTIILSGFTLTNVSIQHKIQLITQNYRYDIPFKSFEVGKTYTIGVKLYIGVNEDKTERMQLKVIEIAEDGTTIVLDSFSYEGANGIVIRSFIPTKVHSKIVLKAHKLDQSLAQFGIFPLYMTFEGEVYDLSRWYFMQPKSLVSITLDKNKQVYEEWVQKTDLSTGIKSTFENAVRLESVAVVQNDDAHSDVIVKLYLLNEMNFDLHPTLLGYPDNLHLMTENRIPSGLEGYILSEPIDTKSWKKGQLLEFNFIIPRQIGIYNLKLWLYHMFGEKAVYLNVDDETNAKFTWLDLGWLNLDLLTEGIIYE